MGPIGKDSESVWRGLGSDNMNHITDTSFEDLKKKVGEGIDMGFYVFSVVDV